MICCKRPLGSFSDWPRQFKAFCSSILSYKWSSSAREWWRGFPETVRSEGGRLPQALHETRSASSPLVSHIYFCCHRRQAEGLPNVIDFVFQCLTRLTQGLPNVMISSMPGTAKRYDFLYRKRLAQGLLERGFTETATVETTECIFFSIFIFRCHFHLIWIIASCMKNRNANTAIWINT